jgi:hypothetical protein
MWACCGVVWERLPSPSLPAAAMNRPPACCEHMSMRACVCESARQYLVGQLAQHATTFKIQSLIRITRASVWSWCHWQLTTNPSKNLAATMPHTPRRATGPGQSNKRPITCPLPTQPFPTSPLPKQPFPAMHVRALACESRISSVMAAAARPWPPQLLDVRRAPWSLRDTQKTRYEC